MQVCCVYIKFKMCSHLQYMHKDRIQQQISLFSQKGCKGQQFFGTGSRPHGVVTFGGVKVFYANETLFSSYLVASKLLMLTAHSLFVITTRQSKKFGDQPSASHYKIIFLFIERSCPIIAQHAWQPLNDTVAFSKSSWHAVDI